MMIELGEKQLTGVDIINSLVGIAFAFFMMKNKNCHSTHWDALGIDNIVVRKALPSW